jgi:hypothetical protein
MVRVITNQSDPEICVHMGPRKIHEDEQTPSLKRQQENNSFIKDKSLDT